MLFSCRTCLRLLEDPWEGLSVNSGITLEFNEISLKEILLECVPELILESARDAILCNSCVCSLRLAYEFKQKCMKTQEKIYEFLQQIPDSEEVDLVQIAVHHQQLELEAQGIEPLTENTTPEVLNNPKVPLSCKWCDFLCLDSCALRHHELLHVNKDPPYKCNLCSINVPNATVLLEHLATHFNEKPYACTICDFTTASNKELKVHSWSHRSSFQCTICWNRYAEKNELEDHVRIHYEEHNAQKYHCRLCDFKTDTFAILKRHTHASDFICLICKINCSTEIDLMKHIDCLHKIEPQPIEPTTTTPVVTALSSVSSPVEVLMPATNLAPVSVLPKVKRRKRKRGHQKPRVRIFDENHKTFIRIRRDRAEAMGLRKVKKNEIV